MAAEAVAIVFSNLAENSLRHGADLLTVSATSQDSGLILLARDNGQGILPANRDKIFTPFFTTSRNNRGTGLGLEICRSISRAHGARIDLHDPQWRRALYSDWNFRRDLTTRQTRERHFNHGHNHPHLHLES